MAELLLDPRRTCDPMLWSFDFCQAFPSLAHDFLWQVLRHWRLPDGLFLALQGLCSGHGPVPQGLCKCPGSQRCSG